MLVVDAKSIQQLRTVIQTKQISVFLLDSFVLLLACGVAVALFVDIGKSQLILLPLWFVNTMIEAQDRVYIPDWALRSQYYLSSGSWLHLVLLKLLETVIFNVGNLGVRILALLSMILIFFDSRKKTHIFASHFYWLLLFLTAVVATLVPFFFIQRGVVWNTIQFWYYTLFLFGIVSAGVCVWLYQNISSKGVFYLLFLGLILLAIPNFSKTAISQISKREYIYSGIIQAASALNSDDVVLLCSRGSQSQQVFYTSILPALTASSYVLVNPVQLDLLGLGGSQMQTEIESTFLSTQSSMIDGLLDNQYTAIVCSSDQLIVSSLPESVSASMFDKVVVLRQRK